MTTMQNLQNRNKTISDLITVTSQMLINFGHKPLKVHVISNKDLATERMQAEEREIINSMNFY